MITCYVCQVPKLETDFHKKSQMCKLCKKAYMKNRYELNKVEILARKEESRSKHPETVKLYSIVYYEENKEYLNKNSKQQRLDPSSYLNRLVIECKERATKKNWLFDLDRDFIITLYEKQDNCCAITGLPFDFSKDPNFRIRPWAPSIDRIDSKLGYTKDNVRLVCIVVNLAINQFGEFIFDKMCKAYIKHNE